MARESQSANENSRQTLPAQKARQGILLGHVRYVLAISLGLSVIAMTIIYLLMFNGGGAH